jgi:hypothetical protein
MKVSIATDNILVIQCENFEGGKETFSLPKPNLTELIYLFFIALAIYFSRFNFLDYLVSIKKSIATYHESHAFTSIAFGLFFILIINNIVQYLFFKKITLRALHTYKIDRDRCILPRPPYNYHKDMLTIDSNFIDFVDEIDVNNDVEIRTTYDTESGCESSCAFTIYKVIIKLRSGEFSTIESNSLSVISDDENQIAFRELIAKTNTAVRQIKSFLKVSEHEISLSSD